MKTAAFVKSYKMLDLLSHWKMKIIKRYKFWQVMLWVLTVILLSTILAAILYFVIETDPKKKNAAFSGGGIPGGWPRVIHIYLYLSVFIYFTLIYYYDLFTRNKRFFSFVKVSLIILLFVLAYHSLLYYIFPEILHKGGSIEEALIDSITFSIILFLFCYLFTYVTVLREAFKQKKVLEAQKLVLETQIAQANFNFLKAQINPHFLHNTLNFLYSRSLNGDPELSEGILTLSDIMRYALRQGNQDEGKATLKDEVEHVRNVIKINQLRYNNQLKVQFEMKGEENGHLIIPFVLITLVENAFKHGDLKDQGNPIDIKLNVEGGKLYFYCRNKKKKGPKELSTGIGLENIRSRLLLAYGDGFKLYINDESEFYTTELTIDKL